MDFQPFHDYQKMVRRGAAEPLMCEACRNEYILRVGHDDEPVLQCFRCGSMITPGLRTYRQIVAATNDYFKRN